MFKNQLDAARQLKEKLEPELGKSEIKIIAPTAGGKKIANYLNKLLNISSTSTNDYQSSHIIIVDNGSSQLEKLIQTVKIYRRKKAKKIIIGIPVYKLDHLLSLQKVADAVYAVYKPKTFISAEEFYHDLE